MKDVFLELQRLGLRNLIITGPEPFTPLAALAVQDILPVPDVLRVKSHTLQNFLDCV